MGVLKDESQDKLKSTCISFTRTLLLERPTNNLSRSCTLEDQAESTLNSHNKKITYIAKCLLVLITRKKKVVWDCPSCTHLTVLCHLSPPRCYHKLKRLLSIVQMEETELEEGGWQPSDSNLEKKKGRGRLYCRYGNVYTFTFTLQLSSGYLKLS